MGTPGRHKQRTGRQTPPESYPPANGAAEERLPSPAGSSESILPPRLSPRLWLGLSVASFAVLTVVLTWPVVARLTTHLAGGELDVLVAQWDCWWVKKVVSERRNPLFTPFLFHPVGVSLSYHSTSWLTGLTALPLQYLFGPTAGYNLVVLLQTFLCAVTMFALVRYLTRRTDAAWLAGFIFAFAPYRLSQAVAHPNLAGTAWIPLIMLGLLRAMRENKPKWAWLAGASMMMTILTGGHLFIMASMLVGLYFVYAGLLEKRVGQKVFWKVVGHFALSCLLLVTPFLIQYVGAGADQQRALQRNEAETKQTDLLAFVVPSKFHPWLGPLVKDVYRRFSANRKWIATVGFVPLVLFLAGALHPRSRRSSLFWTLAAVVFAVLCLGPKLRIAGTTYDVWMPYRLIGWLSPIQALRSPDRWNLVFSLCVSIGAAWGLAGLVDHARPWRKVFLLALPLVVLEYLPHPYPTTYVPVSPFYRALARSDDHLAVLEIPFTRQPSKQAMYRQTIHGHPIVGGMVARTPPSAYRYISQSPLLRALFREHPPPLDCRRIRLRQELERLRQDGVGYIVIRHRWLAERNLQQAYRSYLSYFSTAPAYRDRLITVYTIDALLASPLPCDQRTPKRATKSGPGTRVGTRGLLRICAASSSCSRQSM